MYPIRAFHVFSRFPTRAVAMLLLPAVLVFLVLGCGGGEPAPTGGDAAPESTAESRPGEREPGSGSASANTPEPTAQAASQQQGAAVTATPGPARTEQPAPTATAVSTPLAPEPTLPAETATPVPEGPPTPTPDAAWLLPATLRTPSADAPTPPPGVYPTREDLEASLTFSIPGCVEDFWQMLVNQPFPERFDYLVAQSVNEEFVARRTDCVAQGWDPKFSERVVCEIEPSRAAGLQLPSSFTDTTARLRTIMHSTSGHGDGSLLIHLSAMPFDSESHGCWYYNAELFGWGWLSQPVHRSFGSLNLDVVDRGNVLFGFEPCNSLVKILSERALSREPADSLTASYFSTLVTRVHEFAPDFCGHSRPGLSKTWHPTAAPGPSGDCSVEAETGPLPGGGLVIHWGTDPFDGDLDSGSACWVLSAEGEWSP